MLLAAGSTAQAGPLGLAVIVVLGIALFFLVRSMNSHLRKVPPTFRPEDGRTPREDAQHDAPETPPGSAEPKSAGPSRSDPAD